jgi:hypothetical protein
MKIPPIVQLEVINAIDIGGGQTTDIIGVLDALMKMSLVSRMAFINMLNGHVAYDREEWQRTLFDTI